MWRRCSRKLFVVPVITRVSPLQNAGLMPDAVVVSYQRQVAAPMIADETPSRPDAELERSLPTAANDNVDMPTAAVDPRILVIARAIGRQIARELIETLRAANDNEAEDAP